MLRVPSLAPTYEACNRFGNRRCPTARTVGRRSTGGATIAENVGFWPSGTNSYRRPAAGVGPADRVVICCRAYPCPNRLRQGAAADGPSAAGVETAPVAAGGQQYVKDRSMGLTAGHRQAPAMTFHDRPADRQPHAH